jgi:O-antigen/teichoic acid export membrane protein
VLSHKLFSNTAFAVVDQLIGKIGTTLAFIVLVRVLPEHDIATVGIATSYLVLVAYLDVGLIRILLRDYSKVTESIEVREQHFSGYLLFWFGQVAATLLVASALQWLVLNRLHLQGLNWVFWALTADFLALGLQDWIKVVFYADLRQSLVTALSFLLTLAKLAGLVVLAWFPSLRTYAWFLFAAALVTFSFWTVVFLRRFRFRMQVNAHILRLVRNALADYGIWDHLDRMVIDTLFSIDVAILSLQGQTRDIASYSIALRLTSLMMLVPRQLASGLQVALAQYREPMARARSINSHLKVNLLAGLGQWLVIAVFGQWLIVSLFGAQVHVNLVYHFTIIIAAAVTVLGIGMPLIGVINNASSMRDVFFQAYLPALVLGLLGYVFAGSHYGARGMAWANLAAYGGLVLLLVRFAWRNCPFPLRLRLVTPEEAQFLKRLVHLS